MIDAQNPHSHSALLYLLLQANGSGNDFIYLFILSNFSQEVIQMCLVRAKHL